MHAEKLIISTDIPLLEAVRSSLEGLYQEEYESSLQMPKETKSLELAV